MLINKKIVAKIAIDILMTVLLLFLMAIRLTGYFAHEWIGAAMFLLLNIATMELFVFRHIMV